MYLIEVKHRLGNSYLGFVEDNPVLCCKYKASRYKTEEEANDATCYLQELWEKNYYKNFARPNVVEEQRS